MRNITSILSLAFFYATCFLVPISSGFGETRASRHEDKKLLSILNYDWSVAKRPAKKEEALERVKKLRKMLVGPRGEKGEKGPVGKTGLSGKKGEKGPKGEKGYQGERGEAGTAGLMGETGPMGDIGATGSTGATGPKGARGPQGLCGPTGASNIVTAEGVLNVVFRPHGGTGAGVWQAIVITPSGMKFLSRVGESCTDDVKIEISPVEIGLYTICWRNGFELAEQATSVLKEIEINSIEFNGDNFVYKKLPLSKKGEQRTLCHVVVQELCQ